MKNLTDFDKTVETGVDPRLLKQTDFQYLPCSVCQSSPCKRGESCDLVVQRYVLSLLRAEAERSLTVFVAGTTRRKNI